MDGNREGWRTVLAGILLAKAAVATFSLAPFLIGSYIDRLGLSAVQASRVLSVEVFALALANLAASLWVHRRPFRGLAQGLLLVLLALNLACAFASGALMLGWLRAAIGVVEGTLLALGFGLLGLTRRPDRNFGFYFAASLGVAALNVRLLPLFLDGAGATGLFLNLCLYALLALAGSRWAPHASLDSRAGMSQVGGSPGVGAQGLALGALLLANYVYFIGQGGVWAFLERLGLQQGLGLADVAQALSWSLLAGVAGGFAASALDVRFGRLPPLMTAVALAAASLGLLWQATSLPAFVAAACLFNFANNFGHPYLLGMAAQLDRSGRLTVLSGALHTGGQATGPLLVGLLVAPPDFLNAVRVGLTIFAVTGLLLALVALVRRPARPTWWAAAPPDAP